MSRWVKCPTCGDDQRVKEVMCCPWCSGQGVLDEELNCCQWCGGCGMLSKMLLAKQLKLKRRGWASILGMRVYLGWEGDEDWWNGL